MGRRERRIRIRKKWNKDELSDWIRGKKWIIIIIIIIIIKGKWWLIIIW
jgi:hypothetical protein